MSLQKVESNKVAESTSSTAKQQGPKPKSKDERALDFQLPEEANDNKVDSVSNVHSDKDLDRNDSEKALSISTTFSRISRKSRKSSRRSVASRRNLSSKRRSTVKFKDGKPRRHRVGSTASSRVSNVSFAHSDIHVIRSRILSAVESRLDETRHSLSGEEEEDELFTPQRLRHYHPIDDPSSPEHRDSILSAADSNAGIFSRRKSTFGLDSRQSSFFQSDFDDIQEFDELATIVHANDDAYVLLTKVYAETQLTLGSEANPDINLDPIIKQFAKLWEGIQASHGNELRLIQIDREVSTALSATLARSRFMLKLAEDDPEYAQRLATKLEDAWLRVDAGEEEEQANKNRIDTLKQEIFDLNRSINRASAMRGQDTLKELAAMKAELEAKRDLLNAEANKFRSSLNVIYAKRQELFEKRTNLTEKARLFDEEYAAQHEAIKREQARKEKFAADINEVQEKISNKKRDLIELERNLTYTLHKIGDTEKALRDQRAANESAIRDAELANTRIEKLRIDCETQSRLVERLTLESYRQAQELRDRETEVNLLKNEYNRASRQKTLQTRKIIALKQSLSALDSERENLKTKINFLEQELEMAQKMLEMHKKRVEELVKEKTFVNRNLHRAAAVTSEHANQAANHETAVDSLEKQVDVYNLEIAAQKALIARLENERDFYSNEATKLAHQVDFRLNEMRKQDLMILKYKKKLGEIETQVKKSQQVCDAAMNDKKIFERFLRDTLAEILDNNVKLRRLTNRISSLKYQLNAKDEIIHLEALRYDRTLKETEFFSKQSARIQRLAQDMQAQNQALEAERSTLGCAIAEIEGELSKHSYYEKSAKSRALIHYRKLMDREIELQQVWNTWRKQHSTIRIGASHYKALMKEIMALRFDILVQRRSNAIRSRSSGKHDRFRREEAILESCIDKEKCMIGGLLTQLRHPINVHRWRVLEATNPEAYEMVLKINLLTKLVVDRTNDVKSLNKELQQQEHMYVEVRQSMENCPGLELQEEVMYFRCLLTAKQHQYHLLLGELEVAEAEQAYYKSEVGKLQEKLDEVKAKYFEKLRKGEIRPLTYCDVTSKGISIKLKSGQPRSSQKALSVGGE